MLARGYIELFQGTPLLMQLFLAFFGLGLFGIDVPAWLAAGVALILWTAAFLAEIWRGCVESHRQRANGRRPPASAWATCSRCATSSCRRR